MPTGETMVNFNSNTKRPCYVYKSCANFDDRISPRENREIFYTIKLKIFFSLNFVDEIINFNLKKKRFLLYHINRRSKVKKKLAFKFKRCNEARNVQRIWRILRARSLVYYVYTIIVSFNHPISRFVTFWHDYASLTSATVSRVLRFCLGFMCLDLCRRNSHSILMLASRNVLYSQCYTRFQEVGRWKILFEGNSVG